LRFEGKRPSRRAYHSSFINVDKIYVFGGHDIAEGPTDSLWSFDLRKIGNLESTGDLRSGEAQLNWMELKTSGIKMPPPISNHTSVISKNKMYLYGGSIGLSSNPVFYALDLTKLIWETVRTKPYQNIEENTPAPRDEHTAIIHDEQMIVFGGFVDGERVNHTFRFIFKTGEWKLVTTSSEAVPPPRAGHSATLHVSDESGEPFMYIFGGKDLQNTKLNDLWRLSLTRDVWE